MKKSANIQYVEDCIEALDFNNIKDSNNKKYLDTIERFLNREYGNISNCTDIKIINNKTPQIFGMTVAPSDKAFDIIMNNIMKDTDKSKFDIGVTEYIIEIDSKITSPMMNLTSGEITALLLHEIGHIVMNSKFVEDMNLMYMEAMSKTINNPKADKSSTGLAAMLFAYNYVTKHQLSNEIKNLSVERSADAFVAKSGYAEELKSALNKFAKYYNISASTIYKNSANAKKQDLKDADLFVEYAKSFDTRRKFVQDMIDKEIKTVGPLSYHWKSFLTKAKHFYNKSLSIFIKRDTEIVHESLISRLLGITPNVTKKDLDEIEIEVQMVENYQDKMYLMRKIHNKIDDIDQVLNVADKKENRSKISILSSYRNQLEKLLNTVIKMPIKEKQYGVFVKSPKGYEG